MVSIMAAPPLAPLRGRGAGGVQRGDGGTWGVHTWWGAASAWGPARQSAPRNNRDPQDLLGMCGPNGSVFAKNFGIDGWEEAVE